MPNKTRTFAAGLAVAVAALFALAAPVAAASPDFTHVAFAPVAAGLTSIPIGHVEYCQNNRGACGINHRVVDAMQLSEERWAQLVTINSQVNSAVVPVTDLALYGVAEHWAYPTNGYGDCEDIALEKRRLLIAAGWDVSTLLMAVVREPNGSGHALLMVRTDRGDLVLDNLDGTIRVWTETPYQFVKRQSQHNSADWVAIEDDRIVVASTE
jgi:predicted transglutaminase-like cysteine proteinase